jgi:hypothetical protein
MRYQGSSRNWTGDHRFGWVGFFLDHPRSLGEGYWQHQQHAVRFGTTLISAGVACLIHGLVPALFTRTGSAAVARLHSEMIATRRLNTGNFNSPEPYRGEVGTARESVSVVAPG